MVATASKVAAGLAGRTVRFAGPQEGARLLATLTAPFVNDPPSRWLYSEPERYRQNYPAYQGRGPGGALLRATLAPAEREGWPACLKASGPRNIPFHEGHGFRRLAPRRVGSFPPITPMWARRPQRGAGGHRAEIGLCR